MKRTLPLLLLAAAALGLGLLQTWKAQAQTSAFQAEELLTIRWDGPDNTHVIRPNGNVEFLGKVLQATRRPGRTDERAYYLSIAMNAMAKEGYEFAGRTEDEVIMKRRLQK